MKKRVPKKGSEKGTSRESSPGAEKTGESPCRIVAIGASTGGQEALEQIFTALPGDCGLAFVVIVHLPPYGPSFLPETLNRYTPMQVLTAEEGMSPLANTVYVLAPGAELTLEKGLFRLKEPSSQDNAFHSIDRFFSSLAADVGRRAIAILLSGFGMDGTAGIKAIKAAGGTVIVQAPDSASQPAMPRNAIATGRVDLILPMEALANQIINMAHEACALSPQACQPSSLDENLAAIFDIIKATTGQDFSSYKKNTIIRRIERRMAINDVAGMKKYIGLLETNSQETRALAQEILIGVTSFFRDPEAFETLRQEIIPRLFKDRKPDDPVRIWHTCCATGEEVYSTAILIREYLDEQKLDVKVQFFATDIDETAIAQARSGFYFDGIEAEVDEQRLQRFFTRVEGRWLIAKELREMIVFAHHNLLKDPPFSRLDLLVCRNFLIYLTADMQKRLFPLFHLALRPDGFLFLGSAETTGRASDLFHTVDKKWKIYQRRVGNHSLDLPFPFTTPVSRIPRSGMPSSRTAAKEPDLRHIAEKVLMKKYFPPCVIVNEKYEVIYTPSHSRRFFELPQGQPTRDILKLAREELRPALRAAIYKVFSDQTQVEFRGIKVLTDQEETTLNVIVEPLDTSPPAEKMALVILEPASAPVQSTTSSDEEQGCPDEASKELLIHQLEEQLRVTNEQLLAVTEQLETSQEGFISANEELVSINEEFQSANEELQSTNEELETSKEELQALNEELGTVNAELHGKVEELNHVNNDLENLLASSEIAILFLDRQLTIRRFSPAMASIFNLIPADLGRPFRHLIGTIDWAGLPEDAKTVLVSLAPLEREVATLAKDRFFLMRVLPYWTAKEQVDGVVVTLIDITERKRAEEQFRSIALFPEENPCPVLRVAADGTLLSANRASAKELLKQWECDEGGLVPDFVRQELETALASETLRELEIHCGKRDFSFALVPIKERGYVNLYASDVTRRREVENALRESEERLRMFIEHAPASLAMFDRDMRYLGVSRRWLEVYGKSGDGLIGKSHYEDFPEIPEVYREAHRRGLAGEVLKADNQRFVRADGSIQWSRWEIYPWHDSAGQVGGIILFTEDITKRKHAEEALQASELKFRSIIENVPLGMHMYDLTDDGTLKFIGTNPAADRILGIDNNQFMNKRLLEAFPALEETELPGKYIEIARNGGFFHLEDVSYQDDRLSGAFEIYAFQVSPGRMVTFFQDVTSRKQAEEALREAKEAAEAATRAKGQFLANMSHELRTPMTGVLGMLDLALIEKDPAEQHAHLEAVKKSSQALLRILNDILDFSRIEAGMVTLVDEPFQFRNFLQETVELFELEAQRKGLNLTLEHADNLPQVVKGDEGRIRQILVNLVGNAIKFTERGEVKLRVEAGPTAASGRRNVTFTVTDTGIGIPAEKTHSLFHPFSQGDASHTRRYGGAGLGLTISKEVATRMGGNISFSSHYGKGSTFVATLPLQEVTVDETSTAASPAAKQPFVPVFNGTTRPRLLIAEDDKTIRNLLGIMLEKGGVDFDAVGNGKDAVKMWAQNEYDLILMDVQMPLMDGFEAVREIRSQEQARGGHVPIVALTAHAYKSDQEKCLDNGMDTYLAKPFTFQKLFAIISDVLGDQTVQ